MLKYVFCATTGFNRHNVFNWIFSLVDGMIVEGNFLNTVAEKHLTHAYVALNKGLIEDAWNEIYNYRNIIDYRLSVNDKKRYFAANSFFIQSHAKITCEILENEIGILHLIGNPIDTSLRMLEQNIVPALNSANILSLNFPSNRIKPSFLKYREYRHKFFKALWYCFEVYVRSKDLIANYKSIRHYVFFEKWMDSKVEIEYMLRRFDIKLSKEKLISASKASQNIVLGKTANFVGKTITREKAEKAALRFVDRFGDQLQLRKEECLQLLEL